MAHTVIACLSQKGGVGKSTLSRLIARTYAAGDWRVKIADFNTKQKTSVDWCALRMAHGIIPEIAAEAFTSIKPALRQDYDLLVLDGRPDSDTSTLECAREATMIVVPTGVTIDDLKPQVLFAHELRSRGILAHKIIFVLNKSVDSPIAVADARRYITEAGYVLAKTDLPMKTGYQIAQNSGKALSETAFTTLNERAEQLATELAERATMLAGR
jgi:chromosome partitioning protein